MKAPVLRELLEWAEAQDAEVISEAKVIEAASNRLTEEQVMAVNAQIWGFLSRCLHGTADTMFRRAEVPERHRCLAQACPPSGPRPQHPPGDAKARGLGAAHKAD